MGIGPFSSYAPPGVYTKTITDRSLADLLGGLRIPVIIGVGREYNVARDIEMIRGSSASADNLITNEDVSSQFTGVNANFFVSHYPIVTGDGIGKITYDPRDITVKVDGRDVPVSQVRGNTGEVILEAIPETTQVVKVNYYFKRKDTHIVDENLSAQVDGVNKEFKTFNDPIVDGTNGGITTNSVNDVIVKVDGNAVTVAGVDGYDGVITLATAPSIGQSVAATYYYNTWQDTSDYTPNQGITRIISCGNSPGKSTYNEGQDFILTDSKDQIEWGNAYSIQPNGHTDGFEYFDNTQISATLIADRMYLEQLSGTVDGNNKDFYCDYLPTEGSGRDRLTDDPQYVKVYVGADPISAYFAGEYTVTRLYGGLKKVELEDAPVSGNVYMTYWFNRIGDDRYTFTCVTDGGAGVGEYNIISRDNGWCSTIIENLPLCSVNDIDFASDGITYLTPLKTTPGYSISERISLTFTSAVRFTVSSNVSGGSSGTGWINKTYLDPVTGVSFTITSADGGSLATNVNYQSTDVLVFDVTQGGNFTVGTDANNQLLGLVLTVSNTTGIQVGDSAYVYTYDKAGNEPAVGDYYYITYEYEKIPSDFTAKVYTRFADVEADYGDLSISSKVTMAAWLMFINGARAVAIKQVLRDPGHDNAATQSFLEALEELKIPLEGNIKPAVIIPITTDETVLEACKSHCEIMSSPRYRSERICFAGFPINTSPARAKEVAESFSSERMIFLYPDGAVIGIVDEYGDEVEYVIDGSFIAAAFTGLDVSPAYDVATPMTRKTIIGFKRLFRKMDEVTMDEVATSGITVIEDRDPNMVVRHARTTMISDPLLSELNIITIKDYVQQVTRQNLERFIGIKFLPDVLGEIEEAMAGILQALVSAEIIVDYKDIRAVQDDQQPDLCRVFCAYKPVFALNYIYVTFTLRSKF